MTENNDNSAPTGASYMGSLVWGTCLLCMHISMHHQSHVPVSGLQSFVRYEQYC